MRAGKPNSKVKDASFGRWFVATAAAAEYPVGTRGWQAQLARDTGIEPASISKYMRGEQLPSPDVCQRLGPALRVSPDEIMIKTGARTAGASRGQRPATLAALEYDAFLTDPRTDPAQRAVIEGIVAELITMSRMSNGTTG